MKNMKTCTVACMQINSNHIVDDNLVQIETILAENNTHIDILVLPENFAHMPRTERERLDHAEPFLDPPNSLDFSSSLGFSEGQTAGKIQHFLSRLARRNQIWVVAGSVAIVVDNCVADDKSDSLQKNVSEKHSIEKIYQSCLVYDDSGVLQKRYDKTHLFDVTLANGEQYYESQYIERGNPQQDASVQTPWGLMGLSICYDLRFPEFYRAMSDDTFLICVAAAFTEKSGEAHWQTLLKARAIENQVYIAAAAQTGTHSNQRSTWGHSMLIDPWGKIKDSLSKQQGLVSAEIDFEYIQLLRQQFPCLEHKLDR